MKLILYLFCLIPLGFFSQKNYWQQYINYKMEIQLDVTNSTYLGKQQIEYTNNSPNDLDKIYIHLYWNAFQPNSRMSKLNNSLQAGADPRMMIKSDNKLQSKIDLLPETDWGKQEILNLSQDKKKLDYTINGTIVTVKLATPVKANGGKTVLNMDWKTQVPQIIRRGGKKNQEGIAFTMTQWYPKVAEYDYDGWHTDEYLGREFHGVIGDYSVKITLDANYIVGASGVLQNPTTVNGYGSKNQTKTHTYHFEAKNIHDFAWAADPDFEVETQETDAGIKVYYVYQKKINPTAWEDVKPFINQYFSFMKNHFGAYPYPTYAIIQGGDGGMEYGACTMVLGKHKGVEDFVSLLFHEISHSWFQHIIATDENTAAYLDEGMTTYAENEALYHIFRINTTMLQPEENPSLMINSALDSYQNYLEVVHTGKEEPMNTPADDFNSRLSYNNAAYSKAAVMYTQLGYIIGKQNLDKTFKDYFENWKFKHPTLRDFKHHAQENSGMNLRNYFHYFVNTTKTIDYKIKNVEAYNENQTLILLERVGEIAMPIDLYIENIAGEQLYYIPETDLRNIKPVEFSKIPRIICPEWNNQQSEYQLIINTPKNTLRTITIDKTNRLADINPKDNIYMQD